MRSHQVWSCFLTLFTPLWIIHHFSEVPIDPEKSGQVPRNLRARPTHFVRGSGYYNLERLAWANILLPANASPWKCTLRVLLGPAICTCCSERLARPHHQVQGCHTIISTALPCLMELLLSRISHILLPPTLTSILFSLHSDLIVIHLPSTPGGEEWESGPM